MEFKKELTMEQYIGLIDLGLVDVEDKDIETCEELFAHEYLSEEDALFFEWKAEQAATRASLIEKNRKAKRRKESFKAEHKVPEGLLYKVLKDTDRDFYISKKKAQKWSHETKVTLANKARNYYDTSAEYEYLLGVKMEDDDIDNYVRYEVNNKGSLKRIRDIEYCEGMESIHEEYQILDEYHEYLESLRDLPYDIAKEVFCKIHEVIEPLVENEVYVPFSCENSFRETRVKFVEEVLDHLEYMLIGGYESFVKKFNLK